MRPKIEKKTKKIDHKSDVDIRVRKKCEKIEKKYEKVASRASRITAGSELHELGETQKACF